MHKAKKYLLEYRKAEERAKKIEEQINELRAKYALPSAIQYSDMPKAHNTEHDLSDFMVKLDELTDYLVKAYTKCVGLKVDVLKRLDCMEKDTEKELLWMLYIDGMEWKEVIEIMPYSERHIYRLHGLALNHFPLD